MWECKCGISETCLRYSPVSKKVSLLNFLICTITFATFSNYHIYLPLFPKSFFPEILVNSNEKYHQQNGQENIQQLPACFIVLIPGFVQ